MAEVARKSRKANPNRGSKPGERRGGRQKGTPNKTTADVREAIAAFAEANVGRMEQWLDEIEKGSPAKAMELYLRAIEYHVPKLGRTELTGKDGDLIPDKITIRLVDAKGNEKPLPGRT